MNKQVIIMVLATLLLSKAVAQGMSNSLLFAAISRAKVAAIAAIGRSMRNRVLAWLGWSTTVIVTMANPVIAQQQEVHPDVRLIVREANRVNRIELAGAVTGFNTAAGTSRQAATIGTLMGQPPESGFGGTENNSLLSPDLEVVSRPSSTPASVRGHQYWHNVFRMHQLGSAFTYLVIFLENPEHRTLIQYWQRGGHTESLDLQNG